LLERKGEEGAARREKREGSGSEEGWKRIVEKTAVAVARGLYF
jgi:hypothetical protein